MLIEFTVANYKSIKTPQTFSMVKGTGNERQQDNTFEAPGNLSLLRSAALYGPNASGKSNFIQALSVMAKIVIRSARDSQRGELLPVTTFKLDAVAEKAPTEFEVTFISDGIRYQYGFTATKERVVEEWLFAYPKGRAQRWYERSWMEKNQDYDWEVGAELKGQKLLWKEATRENALFLSTAVQLNSEQLQPVFDWFRRILHTATTGRWDATFTASLCEEKKGKQLILDFLQASDLSICDLQIRKSKFDANKLPNHLPESIKIEISRQLENKEIPEFKTIHRAKDGSMIAFDLLEEESDGTRRLFELAGPWLDSLEKGHVLFMDELHNNLHPKLVRFLVELFHSSETNPKNAQLVFTTHETSILSQEVYRRDQIWFCEKDDEQATQIFPLTDFSPRKHRDNLELMYLDGRYGAVPYTRKLKIAKASNG